MSQNSLKNVLQPTFFFKSLLPVRCSNTVFSKSYEIADIVIQFWKSYKSQFSLVNISDFDERDLMMLKPNDKKSFAKEHNVQDLGCARTFRRRTVHRNFFFSFGQVKLGQVKLGQVSQFKVFLFSFLWRTVLASNCSTAKNPRADLGKHS